jgi:hypothetical protein
LASIRPEMLKPDISESIEQAEFIRWPMMADLRRHA